MRRDSNSFEHSFIHGIQVATPCKADWEKMTGDELSRFCHDCKLNVYNISAMTTEQAEKLLIEKEGRLCVRFYRRPDGKVLTRDCPKGLAAVRFRVAKIAAAALVLTTGAASWVLSRLGDNTPKPIAQLQALVQQAHGNVKACQTHVAGGISFTGDYAAQPQEGQLLMGPPPPVIPQPEVKGHMVMGRRAVHAK